MAKTPVIVSVPELKEILERHVCAESPLNYAIKIVGNPGVGKSEVVRQTAEKKQLLFIDTRLAFKENIDLGGYPVPDHEARRMLYYRPAFIPPPQTPPGFKGVLWFLDEANRAHPTVIQTLFQIITEKVCGEHALPERTAVVLAGNLGEEDNTALTDFDDSALDGRLAVFHLKPDAANWLQWAEKERIHPSIIQYISAHPGKLWEEENIHPNPRGWHQASNALIHSYGVSSHADLAGRLSAQPGSPLEKMLQALLGRVAARDFIMQVTAPRQLTAREVLAGDEGKLAMMKQGRINMEDLLWALSGALRFLRGARETAEGGLQGKNLAELSNTLKFIAFSRADMQVSFFFLLLKQCAIFTQAPRALELFEDREAAEKLNQRILGILEDA